MKWSWLVAPLWLLLVAPQLSFAQPAVDPAPTVEMSERITQDISLHLVDDAVVSLGNAMASPGVAEQLRSHFEALKQFGGTEYIDRVYLRDFGKTTRDMIYKIKFANRIIYVRYLFTVDGGKWRLIHFNYASEDATPLPKEWIHIYPG